MPEVLDRLRDEHATISDLLDDLSAEASRLSSQGVADVRRAGTALDYLLTFPTTSHQPTVDLIVHRLRLRDPLSAAAVGVIELDHADLNRRLERAKAAFACLGPFAGARARNRFALDVHDFVEHARAQIRREAEQLFPAAQRALRADDWDEIEFATAPSPVGRPLPMSEGPGLAAR